MLDQLISEIEPKMHKTIAFFSDELTQIRGNRAQPGLVDNVKVEVYGQLMILKQIATISTPDAKTIAIQPWDRANITSIERAISENQSLGLNPSNDGNIIRINMPPLTEERRRDLAKLVAKMQEEAKISLRNIRHDSINELHKLHKTSQISAEQLSEMEFRLKDSLNKLIDKYSKQIDEIYLEKEKEIMEI